MATANEGVATLTASGAREESFGRSLRKALRPWKRKPLGVIGAFLIAIVVFLGIMAPFVAPNDPKLFIGLPLEPPSAQFPLGTTNLGQDVFSRTIYGAQISVAVGVTATLIGVSLGTLLGILSGFFGGWVDMVVQRVMEVLASFPGLVLALILIAALGRPKESGSNLLQLMWQLRNLELAIALPFIFGNMRIIRSAVLVERNIPYVEAAKTIGSTSARIVLRHVLPNVMPYVIVAFTNVIGVAILVEASLSFLGYGVSVGTPSWGIDLSNRNREYFLQAPWLMVGPAVALSLTVLGFNYFGDALRDILDPRLRGR